MSNEQQPGPDEEQREAWTPGNIRRAMGKSGRLEPTPALRRFTEQFLNITEEYERARRADIIAAGGDPDEDRDQLEYVRWIADQWTDSEDNADRRAALLDRVYNELTLDDVRALRLAAQAAAAVTPRIIYWEADRGRKPADIAAELSVKESYVYRILRERPAGDAPPAETDQ
ncbi:hypothetical protein ACWD1Y_06585 [Streptomyces sp. NPDC002814]